MKKLSEQKLVFWISIIALVFALLSFIRSINLGYKIQEISKNANWAMENTQKTIDFVNTTFKQLETDYNSLRDFVITIK